MKVPRSVLKVAAVACSALLVAGFVAFRAGAFSRPVEPDPSGEPASDTTQFGSSKFGQIAVPSSEPPAGSHPALISSSKSATWVYPPQGVAPGESNPPPAVQPVPKTQSPVLPGSKSIAPLFPPAPPANPAPPPAQRAAPILPGSKAPAPLIPPK